MTSTPRNERIAAARRPWLTLERHKRLALSMFLVPSIVYLVLFFGYPLVQSLYMSVTDFTTVSFITGDAPWVGLDNFAEALASPLFGTALVNTLLFTIASVAGQLVLGVLLALFFAHRFPGNRWMSAVLLLPWLIPLVVTSTVWRWILQEDGAVNQVLSLVGLDGAAWLSDPTTALFAIIVVNIWIGIPFVITIFGAGLQNVPREILEAATLDGAGYWRRFWSITLPTLRPVLSVLIVLGVVWTLKVLDLVLIMTGGGPANATQTVALLSYTQSFREFRFGVGAAYGNILLLLTIVFAFVYVRLTRRQEQEA